MRIHSRSWKTGPSMVVAALLVLSAFATLRATSDFILSDDGFTVYDAGNHVTWLADFNLPASNRFGLALCDGSGVEPCVNKSGSMNYDAASAWITGMNAAHYLGHADWRLPTTPSEDVSCGHVGPHGNSFGFGCTASALGSLYHTALTLQAPNTAVPIPAYTFEPFNNLQPYLYWSASDNGGGAATFSFNTGFQGGNTKPNFLYVLPMIDHKIPGPWTDVPGTDLQVNADGQTVFDKSTGITWLADGNIAATNAFGLPTCTDPTTPPLCVAGDGSMTWDAAKQLVTNMSNANYLNQGHWELPPVDSSCPNYRCDGNQNPMGNLFYDELHLRQGTPVVSAPDIAVGPFHNVQPYLYWACQGQSFHANCQPGGPAPNFEWSFSFGSGFEGTDILQNELYVTVYFSGRSDARRRP